MHLDAWAKLLSPSSVLRYFFDRKPAFFLITVGKRWSAFSSSWRLPKKIVGFLESTCIVSNLIDSTIKWNSSLPTCPINHRWICILIKRIIIKRSENDKFVSKARYNCTLPSTILPSEYKSCQIKTIIKGDNKRGYIISFSKKREKVSTYGINIRFRK